MREPTGLGRVRGRQVGLEATVVMSSVPAQRSQSSKDGGGTIYRHVGDKGGLAFALLDERERELQQRTLAEPPPLGPGAAAEDRLAAFVEAYVELVLAQLDLVLLSEPSSAGAGPRLRMGRRPITTCRPAEPGARA